MSLFSSLFKARTLLIVAVALFSGLAVSACGYRPLYGQAATNPKVEANMSAVSIAHISDRIGQKMHTELERRLHPRGTAAMTTHSLRVSLSESSSNFGVARDTSATRADLRLTAKYSLIRNDDSRQVASGSLFAVVSHNILGSDYATLVAGNDARDRAIVDMGEQLERRMAIYFTNPTEPTEPVRPVVSGAK